MRVNTHVETENKATKYFEIENEEVRERKRDDTNQEKREREGKKRQAKKNAKWI